MKMLVRDFGHGKTWLMLNQDTESKCVKIN